MSRLATRLGLSVMVLVAVLTACATDELTRTPPGLAPAQGTALTAEWAEIAAGLNVSITDTTATPCHRGEPRCLAAVVTEMEARLEARPCAHTSPFAFTYLEMTRGVANEVASFDDAALISVVDAISPSSISTHSTTGSWGGSKMCQRHGRWLSLPPTDSNPLRRSI